MRWVELMEVKFGCGEKLVDIRHLQLNEAEGFTMNVEYFLISLCSND